MSWPTRRRAGWSDTRGASSSCAAQRGHHVGDRTYRLDGGANRIRRQGIRRLGSFWGHAWQAGLFPSGRGFGYQIFPPRKDGRATYNEGYVFEGDGT